MLTGGTIIRYLFGQAEAIRTVASARSAIWTGIILVFLTSIARNYDQTHISESPFKWLFGSLLFSLVSGTWLYQVSYCGFARREMALEDKKSVWDHWKQFMGLFWMTAPIAWLYAIPVERFLEPVEAAKANVTLLAIVSLWRVLLMARVLQVACGAPFSRTLLWVLFPAAVEVLVVFFIGGLFAEAIMRGMGGLRNSPAEDVVFYAMYNAFGVSFWSAPVLLIVAFFWRTKNVAKPLQPVVKTDLPWIFLITTTIFWIAAAIPNQRQLWKSAEAERLLREDRIIELLNFYSAHERKDFAPSRILPPKIYELESFETLPKLLAKMDGKEAPWVRELAFEKIAEMEYSVISNWVKDPAALSDEEKLENMKRGFFRFSSEEAWTLAIRQMGTWTGGSEWLQKKPLLLRAMVNGAARTVSDSRSSEERDKASALLEVLKPYGIEPTQTPK